MVSLTSLRSPLKWAGGKSWLIPRILEVWHPSQRLVEPFVGGGSVVLGLRPQSALLSDLNPYLINFWKWLQRGGDRRIPFQNSSEYYYLLREQFNRYKDEPQHANWSAEAFWILNRLCYNGLWRENSKGKYNVPFGKYGKIYLPDFKSYSSSLKNYHFRIGDFHSLSELLQPDDFIYADPPYDCEFTRYNATDFRWSDQVRLAEWLSQHPGTVVASNDATDRILALYKSLSFDVEVIEGRKNNISSKADDRTTQLEMFATKGVNHG